MNKNILVTRKGSSVELISRQLDLSMKPKLRNAVISSLIFNKIICLIVVPLEVFVHKRSGSCLA